MGTVDTATLLRTCRTRAGLTQRELARRAHTSAAAICLYERGDRIPRTDTLTRLLAAAGASLSLRATWPTAGLDLVANSEALESLLALADALPQRPGPTLGFPPFRAGPA
jgi:transcriptional regulator with XRE-family HTH domain